MKNLGKKSKRILIFGLCMFPISAILYIYSITILATPLLVSGLISIFVGVPYINGIEFPQIEQERINNNNIELSNKREYVQNRMHIFGINSQVPTISNNQEKYNNKTNNQNKTRVKVLKKTRTNKS